MHKRQIFFVKSHYNLDELTMAMIAYLDGLACDMDAQLSQWIGHDLQLRIAQPDARHVAQPVRAHSIEKRCFESVSLRRTKSE